MSQGRRYTAFCGLYCLDCIPSNNNLFDAVSKLEDVLQEIKFEKYAELKAKKHEIFTNYSVFVKVLQEIKKLKCSVPCFEGPYSEAGCKSNCEIRTCVLDKEYEGCWQCSEFTKCNLLDLQKKFHPDLENNLHMLKKLGIENWAEKRGKHYHWSD